MRLLSCNTRERNRCATAPRIRNVRVSPGMHHLLSLSLSQPTTGKSQALAPWPPPDERRRMVRGTALGKCDYLLLDRLKQLETILLRKAFGHKHPPPARTGTLGGGGSSGWSTNTPLTPRNHGQGGSLPPPGSPARLPATPVPALGPRYLPRDSTCPGSYPEVGPRRPLMTSRGDRQKGRRERKQGRPRPLPGPSSSGLLRLRAPAPSGSVSTFSPRPTASIGTWLDIGICLYRDLYSFLYRYVSV